MRFASILQVRPDPTAGDRDAGREKDVNSRHERTVDPFPDVAFVRIRDEDLADRDAAVLPALFLDLLALGKNFHHDIHVCGVVAFRVFELSTGIGRGLQSGER